jgi:arylsulfatase A-like enzyme
MLARGPGFAAGKTVDTLVSLIDIAPTVLSAAGLPPSPAMRGRALQHTLDPDADHRDSVYIELPGPDRACVLRSGRWKLVADLRTGELRSRALYDLERDPLEKENMIEREPAVVQATLEELAKFIPMSPHV